MKFKPGIPFLLSFALRVGEDLLVPFL